MNKLFFRFLVSLILLVIIHQWIGHKAAEPLQNKVAATILTNITQENNVRNVAAAPSLPLQSEIDPSQKSTKLPLTEVDAAMSIYSKDKVVQAYQNTIEKQLKDFPQKKQLVQWLSLGPVLENSDRFTKVYLQLLDELNKNPNDVLEALTEWTQNNKIDPQLKSLTMTLVNQLNLTDSEKIDYFMDRYQDEPYYKNENDTVAISPAIADALIFLKQVSAHESQILDTTLKLMSKHQNDQRLQQALRERVLAYWPDLKGKF